MLGPAAVILIAIQPAVSFEVNNAMIKSQAVAGVRLHVASTEGGEPVSNGTTDDAGRLSLELPDGDYFLTARASGFVPIEQTPISVTADKLITLSMSPLLEVSGDLGAPVRRIQIVLNWGTGDHIARDLDSHLARGWTPENQIHVYFGSNIHKESEFEVSLDVDDTDWGGPETITLMNAPAGEYVYWVHNFSNSPPLLSDSEVTVRVLFGDTLVEEFRPSGEFEEEWRPFKHVAVDDHGVPRLVDFTDDRQQGQRTVPHTSPDFDLMDTDVFVTFVVILFAAGLYVVVKVVVRLSRKLGS